MTPLYQLYAFEGGKWGPVYETMPLHGLAWRARELRSARIDVRAYPASEQAMAGELVFAIIDGDWVAVGNPTAPLALNQITGSGPPAGADWPLPHPLSKRGKLLAALRGGGICPFEASHLFRWTGNDLQIALDLLCRAGVASCLNDEGRLVAY